MEALNLLLRMMSIKGIGIETITRVIMASGGLYPDNLERIAFELRRFLESTNLDALAWSKEKAAGYIDECRSTGIDLTHRWATTYPEKLDLLHSPPLLLHRNGLLGSEQSAYPIVAIVGSRKATEYGKKIAYDLAAALSSRGCIVVSGMARGIDACAHRGAIEAGGHTLAVLGSGIDVPYPKSNNDIYSNLLERGGLVSEYLLGTEPLAYHFPMRNRIIAGLCDYLVVVEAGVKSGSLITANLALDLGKHISAVPGSIFSSSSRGSNLLIGEGAFPLISIDDYLATLNMSGNFEKETMAQGELEGVQLTVFEYIREGQPIKLNAILGSIREVGTDEITSAVTELELRGFIMDMGVNEYVSIE